MKKQLLTAMAVVASLCGYAQTKGTNALSLGVNTHTSETSDNGKPVAITSKYNNTYFNLGYGYFIKDNTKIGIDLNYGRSKNSSSSSPNYNTETTYGANLNYQKYYPLIGKFYAYAGGRGAYTRVETKYFEENAYTYNRDITGNQYNVGAFGGITWFLSKRWAFETELLSANASYVDYEQDDLNSNGSGFSGKQTSFNLSTKGFINNLGFKIYLLF